MLSQLKFSRPGHVKENNDYENTVRNIFSFYFFDKLTVLYKNNI